MVKLFDFSWIVLHPEVGPVKGQECDHRQVPFPGFFAPALENEMRELGPVAGVLRAGYRGLFVLGQKMGEKHGEVTNHQKWGFEVEDIQKLDEIGS